MTGLEVLARELSESARKSGLYRKFRIIRMNRKLSTAITGYEREKAQLLDNQCISAGLTRWKYGLGGGWE